MGNRRTTSWPEAAQNRSRKERPMRRTLLAGIRTRIGAGPRRMTRPMLIIAAGLTAAAAGACAAALATTPGTNGQIAFRRWLNDETSRSALYTMNPDGTGVRR